MDLPNFIYNYFILGYQRRTDVLSIKDIVYPYGWSGGLTIPNYPLLSSAWRVRDVFISLSQRRSLASWPLISRFRNYDSNLWVSSRLIKDSEVEESVRFPILSRQFLVWNMFYRSSNLAPQDLRSRHRCNAMTLSFARMRPSDSQDFKFLVISSRPKMPTRFSKFHAKQWQGPSRDGGKSVQMKKGYQNKI